MSPEGLNVAISLPRDVFDVVRTKWKDGKIVDDDMQPISGDDLIGFECVTALNEIMMDLSNEVGIDIVTKRVWIPETHVDQIEDQVDSLYRDSPVVIAVEPPDTLTTALCRKMSDDGRRTLVLGYTEHDPPEYRGALRHIIDMANTPFERVTLQKLLYPMINREEVKATIRGAMHHTLHQRLC